MNALADTFTKYKPHLRLTIRVTVAALVAYAAMHMLSTPQGYWLVFTAILVTQTSVGGSVKAAVERMLGTFAGAAWGAIICTFAPHEDPYIFSLWVILALAPTSFLAAVKPNFKIAPITVAIMLFGNAAVLNMSPITYAEHRVLDIGFGCIIGLIVSLTVLPSRAHSTLSSAAADVLKTYADLLTRLLEVAASQLDYAAVETAHTKIRAAITRLEGVGDEAKRERKHRLTNEPDPDPLLRMIRRLRSDMVIIGRAVVLPLPKPAVDVLAPPLAALSQTAAAALNAAADALKTDKTVKIPENFEAAFSGFAATLTSLHRQHALSDLPDADASRLYTLSFSLEQLRLNLKDLTARVDEFADDGTKTA